MGTLGVVDGIRQNGSYVVVGFARIPCAWSMIMDFWRSPLQVLKYSRVGGELIRHYDRYDWNRYFSSEERIEAVDQ